MDKDVQKHVSEPLLEIYKILYGNPSRTVCMCMWKWGCRGKSLTSAKKYRVLVYYAV